MSKEKQIEEMVELLHPDRCFDGDISDCRKMDSCDRCKAARLYDAGYRKQSDNTVEVVRCKDCRFNTFTQPNGTIHCHVDGNVRFSKQDDFCNKGRRKEQTDG